MSVRAYKVISRQLAPEATFNCWRNDFVMQIVHHDGRNMDGGGEIEFEKKEIKKLLAEYKRKKATLKVKEITIDGEKQDLGEAIEILEQMIKDCGEDDYVIYDCY